MEKHDHYLSFYKSPEYKSHNWMIREPEDKTDPVRHEKFVKENLICSGLLLGASVRGKSHAHQGKWREDYFEFEKVGSLTILSVADGVGSARLSRIGAKIAGTIAVQHVKQYLSSVILSKINNVFNFFEISITECLKKAALTAISSIEKEAQNRNANVESFATTLILVIHGLIESKHYFSVLQIGDGVVATQSFENKIKVLGKPDFGEYAGQSSFLTNPNIRGILNKKINISAHDNLKSIVIMSDGIADDFFPFKVGLISFFKEIDEKVLKNSRPLNALKEWISYEKVGSNDDRTILIISFRKR